MIINESGGGAGLNLKVVGGTAQPASPKENTVWVNTDTAINGYAFSTAAPTNPVAGMVWFQTGTASSAAMNIDKKNTVMLYPGGCSQYIDGAWVEKDAQTYLNGKWVDWRIYFYNKGNQYLELTGGWLAKGVLTKEGKGKAVTPQITQNADNMTIVFTGAQYANGLIYTKNQIDLTEFKTITINGEANCPVKNGSVNLGVYSSVPSYVGDTKVAGTNIKKGGIILSGVFETTLDVSALSGKYYLTIDFYNDPSGTNTVIVEEFYGEV